MRSGKNKLKRMLFVAAVVALTAVFPGRGAAAARDPLCPESPALLVQLDPKTGNWSLLDKASRNSVCHCFGRSSALGARVHCLPGGKQWHTAVLRQIAGLIPGHLILFGAAADVPYGCREAAWDDTKPLRYVP